MPATVYLVGAGPGDPGLLTLRGLELLGRAHVVVYDNLANPLLLKHAPEAEHIYVGKKAGAHSMTQDRINALLIELARQGQTVVRLKGGDPFVFGRGGEECAALAAAGVPFEVVPGVTAAVAVAAYAGIPVTHRDLNSSFTLVTGHEKDVADGTEPSSAALDWPTLAKLPCLAFYMGLKSLPHICKSLIEHGLNPQTPAAAIQWGTTPNQRTVVGTAATLPELVAQAKLAPPAMTIIGQVVQLRQSLNWFESRPLFGRTILVTRTRQQASDLTAKLQELGAHVLEAPTIEIHPPKDWSPIDTALLPRPDAKSFDWIIFTSPNAPPILRQRLRHHELDARILGRAKIAAVGQATADAVARELALHVDLCPAAFKADSLADALSTQGKIRGRRFLLLRADIARPVLAERLRDGGAEEVLDLSLYEATAPAALAADVLETIESQRLDWITFTSGSTARNFMSLLNDGQRQNLARVKFASIGPITSAAMMDAGLTPTVQASAASVDELIRAIRRHEGTL